MFRYVAFVWDEDSPTQTGLVHELSDTLIHGEYQWSCPLRANGLVVYCAGSPRSVYRALRLARKQGVLLGAIYTRDSNEAVTAFDATRAREVVKSGGRALVEEYWGNYVGIFYSPNDRTKRVIRSPSGIIRCFLHDIEGVTVVCSHVEDCAALGLRFTINWQYVVAELCNCAAMGWEQTGLAEVSSLLPGSCLILNSRSSRTVSYWDPTVFASNPFEDASKAAAEVRRLTFEVVQAWARSREHILLLLSGGLDSSILATCLRGMRDRPRITCLNLYCPEDDGDERRYARLAVEGMGSPLVELQRPRDINLDELLTMPRSARPSSNHLVHLFFGSLATETARERGATIILHGQGGDELFCRQTWKYAVSDYVWMHGVDRRLIDIAANVSGLTRRAIWTELFCGLRLGLLARPGMPGGVRKGLANFDAHQPFLNRSYVPVTDHRFLQKWILRNKSLPFGKLHQIAEVAGAQAYFSEIGSPDDPDWVMPLHSQPLVEFCLRLPTFLSVCAGWNRAMQRHAFRNDIPSEILWRPRKGTTANQREHVFSKNRAFIRELLLNGILAKEGLVDRARVDREISNSGTSLNHPGLARCLRTEAWLQAWSLVDSKGAQRETKGGPVRGAFACAEFEG